MIMATEDSKGTGWIQCDRCDAYFRPMGMKSDTKDGKTIYHYVCPECGYHGTDEIIHEGQKEEEIDMSNYYTVGNAASRLNVCRNTILRAIHNGLFTDTVRDTSYPGAPAYMIPSNQVEYYVSNGGILQIKSRKTKQKPSPVVPKPDNKKKTVNKELAKKIEEAQEKINQELKEASMLSVNDVMDKLVIPVDPEPTGWITNDMEKPTTISDPNKITIEIDASLIEKQISKRFRDQVAELCKAAATINEELATIRASAQILNDELSKLEAML